MALPAEGLRRRPRPAQAPTSQAALGHEGAYLPHDREEAHAADITLEYSRPFRALKLWLALRVHGADAFRAAIGRNLDQARLLYDSVVERPELSRSPRAPQLSVVPFRHVAGRRRATSTRTTPRSSGDSRRAASSGSPMRGSTAAPTSGPCIVNFRTTEADVVAFVEHVLRLGQELAR